MQCTPANAQVSDALVPASVRLQDKLLKDWSNADAVEWANEKCDDVVPILAEKKYKGSILVGWRKEDFEKYLGGAYGAAFYGHLLDSGLLKSTSIVSGGRESPPPAGGSVLVRFTDEHGVSMEPHTFSGVPTFEQLVNAAPPSKGLKIFFKCSNGKYSRICNDEELLWAKFYRQNGMYYARLAQSTPVSSPEKASGNMPLAPDCRLPESDAVRLVEYCLAHSLAPAVALPVDNQLSVYDLGLLFPVQHMQPVAMLVAAGVEDNWKNWCANQREKRRAIASFAAAGASGTGKTRFGAECASLVLEQLRTRSADATLIAALDQCVSRCLTLRYECRDPSARSADVLWDAYVMRPGIMPVGAPQFAPPHGGVREVYEAIAAVERRWRPFDGPIAVLVHLDEVQRIPAVRLGQLLSVLLEPFDDAGPPPYKIFPIIYFSGTDQLHVQATKSSRPPDLLPLPLLTSNDYTAICRALFPALPASFPSSAVRRAFASVEGPPRLLLLLLWALQARLPLTTSDLLGAATSVRRSDISQALLTKDDAQVSHALDRAVRSLPRAQVPIFVNSLQERTTRLICALALLAEQVRLSDQLDDHTTVSEAISRGHAQSTPVAGAVTGGEVILHWPRLYIWYFQKNMTASEDSRPPLPMPPNAGTPTKESARVHDSGAARNEEADIQLLCLRLFCQRELCTWRGSHTCPLWRLLPLSNLGSLGDMQVKLPGPQTMVRPQRTFQAIHSDESLALLLTGTLPVARVNRPVTSFADSILILELAGEAPAAITPVGALHKNKLAIFIQSKKHTEERQHTGERFTMEYEKCAGIKCVPWIFVMISDADHIARAASITLPWKGNGFFVGRDDLERFYGQPLYLIRAEEWATTTEEPTP